jgi:hypothetical protein
MVGYYLAPPPATTGLLLRSLGVYLAARIAGNQEVQNRDTFLQVQV